MQHWAFTKYVCLGRGRTEIGGVGRKKTRVKSHQVNDTDPWLRRGKPAPIGTGARSLGEDFLVGDRGMERSRTQEEKKNGKNEKDLRC